MGRSHKRPVNRYDKLQIVQSKNVSGSIWQGMTTAKPKWPKILHWLSPLLFVSLGLHGLGLLLPVPEKPEEIERPEFIEPESIQVSTLPITPEPTPEPEPPSPEIEEAPPVTAPPQEPFPLQAELPPEDPIFEEEFFEEEFFEEDANFQEQQEEEQLGNDSENDVSPTRYTHSKEGTSANQGSLNSANFILAQTGGVGATNALTTLELTYTADQECFDPLPGPIQLVAIVDRQPAIAATEITRKSGYQEIDSWLNTLLQGPLPPEAFAQLNGIDDGFLLDWINETRENQADSIVPDGKDKEAYGAQIAVTIEGNQCDE